MTAPVQFLWIVDTKSVPGRIRSWNLHMSHDYKLHYAAGAPVEPHKKVQKSRSQETGGSGSFFVCSVKSNKGQARGRYLATIIGQTNLPSKVLVSTHRDLVKIESWYLSEDIADCTNSSIGWFSIQCNVPLFWFGGRLPPTCSCYYFEQSSNSGALPVIQNEEVGWNSQNLVCFLNLQKNTFTMDI